MTGRLERQGEPGELTQILPRGMWPGKSLPGAAGLGKEREIGMSRGGELPH